MPLPKLRLVVDANTLSPVNPFIPLPAKVVIMPVVMFTFRILKLPESVM